MKRLTALLLVIGLCAVALLPSRTHAERPDAPPGKARPDAPPAEGKLRRNATAIKNHYIVVFNESVKRGQVGAEAENLARQHGGTIGYTYENALRGFSVEMSEAAAEALSRNPKVEFVEEDAEVEGASTQTSAPWQLDRLDQRNPTLNNSYTYDGNGAGVNAYIIDGGIRYTHQEFGGRAAFAYDYVAGGNGVDCNGHGTHVAALIGGNTYGVAKGAKLWSVRVLDCANGGTLARIIAGVDWVTANHVKPAVANLSFITIASSPTNGTMDIAVKNLIASGVTTVVAAGNNSGEANLRTPARVPEAITVAATDPNDNRAPFSNFGSVVDVFAPGVDIVSAHSTGDTDVFTRSGTSSAAPIVAGIAARYLSTRPGDAPDAVSQAIMNNASTGKVINPGSDATPNRLAYTGITVSDDFNDNTADTTKWNVAVPAGGTVVEQGGRLEVTPPASTTGYGGYYSATTVDLTDSRVSVEVTPGNAGGYGAETYLSLAEGNSYVLFATGGGNLLFQTAAAGAMTRTYIPYSPTLHRFWRLRHVRATDQIHWETSPDGVTWTVQRTVARQFPITNLQTQLQAGKYTATTPGGTTIYDNLWHEPNPTPSVAMADDFNDNSLHPLMWATPDQTSPTTVAEQNGRVEVTLQPNVAGYNSLGMAGDFDFRDKTLQVEVQTASQAGWVETYFQLYYDSSNYVLVDTGAGSFTCDSWVNGVRDRTLLNWDGSRYWRFRHDSNANTISFETSADNVTWATRKTVAAAYPLHAVRAAMGAGAWGTGNGAPGFAAFDNFRLERYSPLFPLSDNFNDNARAAKWNTSATPGVTVVEQNGQLQITPPDSTTGYDGFYGVSNVDLTDARASVEVVQTANGGAYGIETTYQFSDPATGNYMLFDVGGGNFLMQDRTNGVVSRTLLSYNATQHRFWRFRHNRAADTLNYETSPDGVNWTTLRTVARPFSITNLQAYLYAGKYTATTPTATAIFDNLRIERNEGGKAR